MTVYADELFAVNFVSNILLFYAYSLLRGIKPRRIRVLAAAAVGGLYAVIETVFGLHEVIRIPVLACMIAAAFGRSGFIVNLSGVMFVSVCAEGLTAAVLSFAGADARLAAGRMTLFASEPVSAAAYLAAYPIMLLCGAAIRRAGRRRRVVIEYGGRRTELFAMYDSGNLLRYKGLPVIVIGREATAELFECDYSELLLRAPDILRCNTVGGGGMLPVFIPENCVVDGSRRDAAVAVADRGFRGFGGITGDM
ncbi:MAG TPA: sigma-E processing peptidase SpoIIGA [Candidatus Ornithomonoglobus merdipullorum]|uniref:Sigma-E processing peptidase SpoIIGA n=1 Tax=Candidatus Ornithomonoglobus merdipullorum TaxID=2840895 RepID=A0A9D1MCN2_9FIRM|nr:sigma-E processing peptidase SpoIIGA [Candidatus Ornithomonoglobus merdipullorum]